MVLFGNFTYAQISPTAISLYVAIPDSTIITQVLSNGKPVFNNTTINSIINQYNFTDFHKAFPGARHLHLKQIYQLKCNSSNLGAALKNGFPSLFPYYELMPDYQSLADYYPNEWNSGNCYVKYLDYIGAPTAWGISKGDPNTIIGVTDGYFDMTNPDLAYKIAQLRNNTMPYYNAATGQYNPEEWLHGTLVAGLIAGATDNNYKDNNGLNEQHKFIKQ